MLSPLELARRSPPTIGGIPGLVWGFVVSTLAVFHATMLVNSRGHLWGPRRYPTGDQSRNNPLLALLTLGDGWHNNHHFYMTAARHGFFWWELDFSYYALKLLSWLGAVWDVREPPAAVLEVNAPKPAPIAG
jgi:stearoyl-CoA desaturase (delta-9 desaturase)